MARGIEVHNGKVNLKGIISLDISRTYKAGETISGTVRPFNIYLRDDETDPLTMESDLHALWITDMISATPAGNSSMLRLEFNALAAASRTQVISVPCSPDADFEYLLSVNEAAKTAWDAGGDKTGGGAGGWLRCKIGTSERWIQLYKP